MKIDDSNKRYTRFIAGILIISGISIFVALILGFGGYQVSYQYNTKKSNMNFEFGIENGAIGIETSKIIDVVTVAEKCVKTGYDTAKGSITYVQDNIPAQLPLCLDESVIDNWWIEFQVVGGYDPNDYFWQDYGLIEIYQPSKSDKNVMELRGQIKITEVIPTYYPCYTYMWNLTGFDLVCGTPIRLDSNHIPDIIGCTLFEVYDGQTTLGKEVDLHIYTNWEGCHLESQEFRLILSQKNQFFGIPNSRK